MKPRKRFRLGRDNKKFLGVCAGIADYLEVQAWTVRLVFIVSVFMGAWFLIPAYFVLYLCMDTSSGGFKEKVTGNPTFKHFKNVDYRKRLYRNTEDGKFLGVCAGIADYLEVDVTVVRLITFVLLFVAGPIPWIAYFAAYFVLDKKPATRLAVSEGEWDQEEDRVEPGSRPHGHENHARRGRKEKDKDKAYTGRREFRNCARKFANLHQRLARMEAYVTSKEFKLRQEFKNIS